MSLFGHILACNNADLTQFLPFLTGEQRIGWIHRSFAGRLDDWPDVFDLAAERVSLAPRYNAFASRSAVLDEVLRALAESGEVSGWRGEVYPVMVNWGDAPILQMERAACPRFGIRAFGVHINGFVRKADGIHMWVARRAYDKPTFPGMLDNMVAGGQPIGIGLMANVIKECAEEAGIPEDLVRRAVAVGMISYTHQSPEGCKPDQMFCYDMELPEHFIPTPTDGEVAEFYLWPIAKVAETVRDSFEFKFNCNLCIIDFLVRHGVIDPDNEPDYTALVHGLRAGG